MFKKERDPNPYTFIVLYAVAGMIALAGFANIEYAERIGFSPWPGIGAFTLGTVVAAVTGTAHYIRNSRR